MDPAAVGHLRVRPGHPRRAQLALLRGHRVVSLRPRPRGGRHRGRGRRRRRRRRAGRGHPGGARAGAGLRGPRASSRPARPARPGNVGNCGYLAFGHIRPGLQTGFCADTGGGWSTPGSSRTEPALRRARGLSDEDAVTVEPTACAVHAVLGAPIADGDVVAVLGAGTLGLLVTAALSHLAASGRCPSPSALLVGARYAHQRRLARRAGRHRGAAPRPAGPGRAAPLALAVVRGRVRRDRRRCRAAPTWSSTAWAAPSRSPSRWPWCGRGARWCWSGMPGQVTVDLAPLWHREVRLAGAYAYGTERRCGHGRPGSTFALAFEVVAAQHTGRLVSATYPLARFEDAVAHAGAAGRRGRREDRLRRTERTCPMSRRPGFVLEVDSRRHRPCSGTARASRLETLPEGSRVIYAPEPMKALEDPDRAIRHALLHPLGRPRPAAGAAAPRHEAHHLLRRRLAAAAPDGGARHPPAGDRDRCSTWRPRPAWTTWC